MVYVDRAALRMSDAEREVFLREHCWARLATVNAIGEPHVAPIGFVSVDEKIYFHALMKSRRGRDLAAGSLVSLCVDDGVGPEQTYSDRRGVIAYGKCPVIEFEDPRLVAVRARFAEVFFGTAETSFERRTHAWYELSPDRYVSWDFGRIPPGADAHGG